MDPATEHLILKRPRLNIMGDQRPDSHRPLGIDTDIKRVSLHYKCHFTPSLLTIVRRSYIAFCFIHQSSVSWGGQEPAYNPQVEAISPTLPLDDYHQEPLRASRDELLQQITKVDREILKAEAQINKLKKKQVCRKALIFESCLKIEKGLCSCIECLVTVRGVFVFSKNLRWWLPSLRFLSTKYQKQICWTQSIRVLPRSYMLKTGCVNQFCYVVVTAAIIGRRESVLEH